MEIFSPYGHAIVALALMVLVWAVMNPLGALKKQQAGTTAGGIPETDYASPAYRWHRAYSNLTETMPFFATAVFTAILAGASPFWVNLHASVFFVSRIAVAYVHIKGIGKPGGGLRSQLFVVGWAICIILAIMAIWAVF